MRIELFRLEYEKKQTLGECAITENGKDIFLSKSLERADNNNQRNISCIPSGEYLCVLEYSNKFDCDLWEIKGVPNRSECKFHSANYWHDLNGCVALGSKFMDINNDGFRDVLNSKKTMKKFHKVLEGLKEVQLIVH
tara:strand:- start:2783 stop:3193 length:411 start_codon:yes stop_codon:yes gene_type:complete